MIKYIFLFLCGCAFGQQLSTYPQQTGAASSCSGGIAAGCTGVTNQAAFTALTPNNSLYASLAAGSTDDARITNQESAVTAGGTIYTSTGAQSWTACPTFSTVSHTLVLQGSTTVNANCTVPANVTLDSSDGAELNTASGITVVIQGGINVNKRQQWINSALTGGSGSLLIQNQDVYMDWCGADPNGTSDAVVSSGAFATCAAAHPGGRLLLNSNVGTNNLVYGYLINTMLRLNNTQRLECEEPQSCIVDGSLMTATANPAHTAMIAFSDSTVTTYPYTQTNSSGGLSGVKLAGTHLGGTINPNLSCLYLGGDPNGVVTPSNYGAANLVFYSTYFAGCNAGMEWGSNSYSHTFFGGGSSGNNYGLYYPSASVSNSGEVTSFSGFSFNDNNLSGWSLNNTQNSGNWELVGAHFDFNGITSSTIGGTANTTITGQGPAITASGAAFIQCLGCNLEQYTGHLVSGSDGTNTGYPFVFDCGECTYGLDAPAHSFTVSAVSNATPAVVTVGASSTLYPLYTGMYITMASVAGCTSVNGNSYPITVLTSTVSATTFSLTGVTCNSSYTSGGTASYYDPDMLDYGATGNTAASYIVTGGNPRSGGHPVLNFIQGTGSSALKPQFVKLPFLVGVTNYADTSYWFGGNGTPGCWTTGSSGSLTSNSCPSPSISGFSLATPYIGQNAANNWAGTCSMSASTSCTITIAHAFTTPVCIATQQSATLTGASVGCTVSGTTVTVTSAVSNSETWGAIVFGNPN